MHSATFGKGKRYGILGYLPEQGSKEAELYALNASTSPLLLLPPEIRNKIYALLLAHRRIHVLHAPRAHPPKFHCLTLRASANPWAHKRRHVLSRGMTLLAGVCRQLYRETDLIPYREFLHSINVKYNTFMFRIAAQIFKLPHVSTIRRLASRIIVTKKVS
ncbi:hypothetical protein CGCS363_v009170 [Colletotrichum siamense]|uniref:uncharacterized protein n=1 Tax=Colletotrichum siamense TaxID=690259 RepID=UPI0018733445|nr:uncharacterized protein CGCS363_v009170 [Colletotrichum siamense]KAF5494615.1 hypothetical protein CGCS363_v009170 [Colletotrichum siamense]